MVNHWLIMAGWWLNHLPLWKMMERKSVGIMTFPSEWQVIKFHGSKPSTRGDVSMYFPGFDPAVLNRFYDYHHFPVANRNWLVVYLPLWNILVSWDDYSHISWKIIQMFATTNQEIIELLNLPNQACRRFRKFPFQVAQSPADVPTQHQGGKEQPVARPRSGSNHGGGPWTLWSRVPILHNPYT